MTLDDLAVRLDNLHGDLREMKGHVDTALQDGSRIMGELRDEMRLVRAGHEDTRQRVTAVEGRVTTLEEQRLERDRARQAAWTPLVALGLALVSYGGGILTWLGLVHGGIVP